jgi:hypothetical protein
MSYAQSWGGRVAAGFRSPTSWSGDLWEKTPAAIQSYGRMRVRASLEEDYIELFRTVGFADPIILRRYDYFSGSASIDTRRVAHSLGAMAVELRICK